MKTVIPSTAKDTQNPASSPQRSLPSPRWDRLGQLAAIMNQGPQVQAQLKLSDEIQNSEPVQKQLARASEINHASSAEVRPQQTKDEHAKPGNQAANPEPVPDLGHPEPAVAQLYQDLGEGGPTGYGKGGGVNAPTFEFQKFTATTNTDPTTSTKTYGVDAAQVVENAPNLRVSNNNDLAVPTLNQAEAKRFFAIPGKIQESNKLLHDSGSPLRLTQGTGQVNLPAGGPTLYEVTPDLNQVVNNSSECGNFAANILGVPVSTAELATGGGPQTIAQVGPTPWRPAREAQINLALGTQVPSQVGADQNADPEVGEAFGIYARTNPPASGAWQAILNGMAAVRNRLLVTIPYLKWGEHWAGVVAKSGGDYVTLENYNRTTSSTAIVEQAVERDYKELRGISNVHTYQQNTAAYAKQGNEDRWQRLKRLGRNYTQYAVQIGQIGGHFANDTDNWYFAMYGSGAQSFHEAWKNALPNSVTMKVHASDQEQQTQLVAQLRTLVPADNYAAGTQAALNAGIRRIQNAVGRPAIIAAYLTSEKKVCYARLAAAQAYLSPTRPGARRRALNQAHQTAIANVRTATGDAVKQACNTGIINMQAT